ncbi:lycopene cyclase family protein [Demequina iriomotensis]|uniref:lycopene cyclase family protein n=1 Tax=Demequina iriomotensis TaxID=1536641 RepID=UPI000783A094|nr:lycopene cyclase family protein [Demequina iriomotensis]
MAVARADALIVGGGAAGLSLVCHLAAARWDGRLTLVDDGARPPATRAWAWWSRGDGLTDPRAAAALPRALVAGPGWERRMSLAPYAYRLIEGAALEAAAQAAIAGRPTWRRVRGRVVAVTADDAGARVAVESPGGPVELRARRVLDSVGVGATTAPREAWALDFLGVRLRSPAPVFDPSTVTLMDFRTDQEDGVAFMYVLPRSPYEALVERTVFASPGSIHAHEPALERYVRAVVGGAGAVTLGREHGRIPLLTAPPARPAGAVVPIGAHAGLVRASTGYGFARIQRHSAALAGVLATGGDPARAAPPHRWHRALDAALLRLVREDPDGARDVLGAMLRRNPPGRVLAFLDEDASALAQLRLFASLPEFARAGLRSLVPHLGAR